MKTSVSLEIDSDKDFYFSFNKNTLITDYNAVKNKEEHMNLSRLISDELDIYDMQIKSFDFSKVRVNTITNLGGS